MRYTFCSSTQSEAAVAAQGRTGESRSINTGGGAYVEGTVTAHEFVGRDKTVTGVDAAGLADLFGTVYDRIARMPERPDVDKDELRDTVEKVEREAAKGADANPQKIGYWLNTLAGVVPDVVKVVAAALVNPVAGVAAAVQVVASRFAK